MHIHDGLRGDNIDSLIGHEKDTSGWVNVSVSQLRSNQFKSQLRRSVCPDQFFFWGGGSVDTPDDAHVSKTCTFLWMCSAVGARSLVALKKMDGWESLLITGLLFIACTLEM